MQNTIKNNSLKFILFIGLILLVFYSCKEDKSNKIVTEPISNIEQNREDEFQRKLTNEPKLFLKYWSGMTYSEYSDVSELLVKEGVLEKDGWQLSYLTNDCRIPLETIHKNDLIIGIKLTENIDCIYPLYEQKYNLPSMVEKNMDLFYLKANNPKYSPVNSYYNGTNTVYLPNCFVDKTSLLSTNVPQKLDINSLPYQNIKKILPQEKIIIENGSNIILIEQEIKTSDRFIFTYSLEDSEEMKQYERSEEGQKYMGLASTMTEDKNSQSGFIYQNSKTRSWVVSSYSEMSITYISKKEYLNQKFENSERENDNKTKKLLEQKKKEELKKKVLDEI